MISPELAALTDLALLLLRLMIAAIFGTSGWSHMTKPRQRAESIGLSPGFTLVLGVLEVLGAASIALGVYAQLGAIVLIGVMLGAIQKKIFVWKTGFWGDEGQGWYYDTLYLVCCLVIVTTAGGALTIV
ncbi:MAG TPA: DoxX family protein [Gemmatimonadota bacterium]|nr:DoxX family protein [Gemmatimonadota bacterium]